MMTAASNQGDERWLAGSLARFSLVELKGERGKNKNPMMWRAPLALLGDIIT